MMGNFADMAPEDIFAMGIQKGLQMVKDMGRDGDTEIVHVNQQEKQALKDMGGRGSVNPASGLREYPPAGADIEGSGRGRDPTGGAGGDRDDAMGRSAASRTQETRALGDARESQTGGGVSGSPTSAGGSVVSGDTVGGSESGADERSFGARVADAIGAALQGPSFGAPTSRDPGLLGVAAGLAPGIGAMMGLTRGLQAFGLESEPEYDDRIGDPNRSQRDDGILSPGRPQQPQAAPNQTPQFAWQRPDTMPTAPMGLGFDAGMSPLQQRTAVATGGTNADAGVYRDPAIVDFYRNLALFDLTQPGGAPRSGAQVTDIEKQYVGQLGGQPGSTVQEFLKALSGLQSA